MKDVAKSMYDAKQRQAFNQNYCYNKHVLEYCSPYRGAYCAMVVTLMLRVNTFHAQPNTTLMFVTKECNGEPLHSRPVEGIGS